MDQHPNKKATNDNNEPMFRDISEEEGQDYLKGTTDFTDYAEIQKKKKTYKIIALVVSIIIVAIICAIIAISINPLQEDPDTQNSTNPQQSSQQNNPQKSNDNNNPLLNNFTNAPTPNESQQISVNVEKNAYVLSTGYSLNIANGKVYQTATPCNVTNTTDFCLAGDSTLQDKQLYIYLMKDAVHSRFFEKSVNFEKIDIEGSATAGIMDINLSGESKKVMVIVNKDSSGFMIVLPDDNQQTISMIQKALSISLKR